MSRHPAIMIHQLVCIGYRVTLDEQKKSNFHQKSYLLAQPH